MHARNSSLFSNAKTFNKPINESLFGENMMVHNFVLKNRSNKIYGRQPINFTWSILKYFVPLLSILGKEYGLKNVGLFREYGLACFHKISGPMADKIREDIIKTFRENFNLKINITINSMIADFLDVTFDLISWMHRKISTSQDTERQKTYINSFAPNAPFLYPLETSENSKVF